MDPIDPIDPEPEKRRKEAFAAAPFHWKDIQLHPLAILREANWLSHCARIGLPPLHEVINSPEAFAGHAVRLIWFCAHDPSAWLAVWMKGGEAAPILLETIIGQWAEEHISPGDQVSVLKLALEIYDRSRATRAQPVGNDEAEDSSLGEQHGQSPSPNTSPSLRDRVLASSPSTTSSTNSTRPAAGPTSTATAPARARRTNGPKRSPKKKPKSARG